MAVLSEYSHTLTDRGSSLADSVRVQWKSGLPISHRMAKKWKGGEELECG